jgi:hypothetical protein
LRAAATADVECRGIGPKIPRVGRRYGPVSCVARAGAAIDRRTGPVCRTAADIARQVAALRCALSRFGAATELFSGRRIG